MGYYIETPMPVGKAKYIAEHYDGQIVPQPTSYEDIPESKGLIVVLDNGFFEAAGFVFSELEFEAFTDVGDIRPRKFVLIDRKEAEDLSGYTEWQKRMQKQ